MTLRLNRVALRYACSCCRYEDSNLLGLLVVSNGKCLQNFWKMVMHFFTVKITTLLSFETSVDTRIYQSKWTDLPEK